MKPNFALTLSFEGIGLLHRAFPGWTSVGEVTLDSPDLAADLEQLRAHAVNVASGEIRCKLVLPNDQIKYLRLPTNETDPEVCTRLVREALVGATPYAAEELAYDWSHGDGALLVAAVTRDTLFEAENFAAEHGFQPFSFVATPENGDFTGEPYFGRTRHAEATLSGDDEILRDSAPIRVIGTARPLQQKMAAPAETPEPEAESEPEGAPARPEEEEQDAGGSAVSDQSITEQEERRPPEPETFIGLPVADQLPPPDQKAPPPPEAKEQEIPQDVDPAEVLTADAATLHAEENTPTEVQEPQRPEESEASAARFASIRVRRDAQAPEGVRPLSGVARHKGGLGASDDTGGEAPGGTTGLRAPSSDASPAATLIAPYDDSLPVPPRISTEPDATFLSRRRGTSRQPDPVKAEAERMTVFGARKSGATRGKPRHLALILTVILVMFLATVAAWAAIFMDEGIAGLFSPRQEESFQITGAELLNEEELAVEGEEAMVPEAVIEEAALIPVQDNPTPETAEELEEELAQDLPEPEEPVLTEEEATRRYAVSGIWQMSPQTPDAPLPHSLEDLYVASIDSTVTPSDAVALPSVDEALTDIAPPRPGNPAAAGTRFDLDQRGLVVATAEGALAPNGFTVYAGLPSLIPAAFPDRSEDSRRQSIGEATAISRLSGFRPKPRPENLEEENERASLGGLSREEFAAFRPKLRPEAVETQVEELQSASAQAIATSRKPEPRPENFASAIENAVKQAGGADYDETDEGESQPTQVAAARAVVPTVPSSASVAQQATVRNAINLRKVNLIGVYGKTSNRRALVRLSNGRYQKVQVGDRVDGGRVAAIGDGELLYTKRGRNIVLRLPKD